MECANCGRGFNCAGTPDCWCLQVERVFDYEEYIIRTGSTSCVCPVCLTGKELPPEAQAPGAKGTGSAP